ncbi:uncharacterized protein LOC127282171 [Leptopilina boulardi]|uniref:uncharacterized protein LOC127282171 n=1 Tax=Leptopilina boulardi TaxID=63433 RepID=UPI0021F65BE2|nr:uncharacterized protein LOC127282171 [Leptopilina boulardi]
MLLLMLQRLDSLEAQNQQILQQQYMIFQELNRINNVEKEKLSETFLSPLTGYPLNEFSEFNFFESEEGKETRTKLYNHLLNNGGTSLRSFLSNALRQTLTDKLVCNFTWNGKKDTMNFGNTRLANVLYQSAKQCMNLKGPLNKEDYKSHMFEVLRHTKQRYRSNIKKNLPSTADELERAILELEASNLDEGEEDEDNANDNEDDNEDGDDEDDGSDDDKEVYGADEFNLE